MDKDTADVTGDLTILGVTKPVVVKATFLGEGKDPWGGYRARVCGTWRQKKNILKVKQCVFQWVAGQILAGHRTPPGCE